MGKTDPELEPWDVEFNTLPQVLIMDFTCEIDDADSELNTVKFTYQFADRRPYLPQEYLSVDKEKIFTAEYNPAFE